MDWDGRLNPSRDTNPKAPQEDGAINNDHTKKNALVFYPLLYDPGRVELDCTEQV